MTIDNAEFIARHHRGAERPEEKSRKKLIVALILVVVYIALSVTVAVVMDIQKRDVIAAGLVFIAAGIVSYFVQKALNIRSAQENERLLLREVLEGSRGARLITDSVDRTIYHNHLFEELCKEIGKPSLVSLTKLFSNDEDTLSHFRLLADQAHRGLTDSIELRGSRGEGENWFMVTAQPVAGWAGYIHWRVDDITNKRRDDRAVREEREKLIDFTDNAPVGFSRSMKPGNLCL